MRWPCWSRCWCTRPSRSSGATIEHHTVSAGWPATLRYGPVTLRPLGYRDARAWRAVRRRNAAWLQQWDATVPAGGTERPATFRTLVGRLNRHARHGHGMPFALDVEGKFSGQVT